MKKITIKEAEYSKYEGQQILWSYAKTKKRAYLEMIFCFLGSGDKWKIDFEKIKHSRAYYCNDCEFTTLDDDLCCECGEPTGKQGKEVYWLDLENE